MQAPVHELVRLGPLPSSEKPDMARMKRWQGLLAKVEQPISDGEARELVKLFGPDDCFGLAWTLVHLIESAPGWPLEDCLDGVEGEWADLLRQRWRK